MDLSMPKPGTSRPSDTREEEADQEAKKRKKDDLKAYHKSLHSSEKIKLQNLDKIRLRKLPPLGDRPPNIAAIEVLNEMFETELTPADIVDCHKVPSWYGPEPTDLVVTFINEEIRNYVYNKRSKDNEGFIMICDELGEERLEVWKILVKKYGLKKVYTFSGAVHLDIGSKCKRFLTLRELQKFEDNNKET